MHDGDARQVARQAVVLCDLMLSQQVRFDSLGVCASSRRFSSTSRLIRSMSGFGLLLSMCRCGVTCNLLNHAHWCLHLLKTFSHLTLAGRKVTRHDVVRICRKSPGAIELLSGLTCRSSACCSQSIHRAVCERSPYNAHAKAGGVGQGPDESPVVRREVLVVIIERQLVCYALVHQHSCLCRPTPRHIVLSIAASCSPATSRFSIPQLHNIEPRPTHHYTTVGILVTCTPAKNKLSILPTAQYPTSSNTSLHNSWDTCYLHTSGSRRFKNFAPNYPLFYSAILHSPEGDKAEQIQAAPLLGAPTSLEEDEWRESRRMGGGWDLQ